MADLGLVVQLLTGRKARKELIPEGFVQKEEAAFARIGLAGRRTRRGRTRLGPRGRRKRISHRRRRIRRKANRRVRRASSA